MSRAVFGFREAFAKLESLTLRSSSAIDCWLSAILRGKLRNITESSGFRISILLLAFILCAHPGLAASPETFFRAGTNAYHTGDYTIAATAFRQAAARQPASGTLQNLGNAEWQRGEAGAAVLAWEQALWLDPFNGSARNNLRFARKIAQLETPELAWHEVVSTWLPVNWWAWIAGLSLWLAVGMGMLPGILRLRKTAWHQAVAALGLAIFLLSVPALLGVVTRSRIGFVLQKDTPLRLTPTQEAQFVTRLAAGEPARVEHARGQYLLIRTSRTQGWIQYNQIGLMSGDRRQEAGGSSP